MKMWIDAPPFRGALVNAETMQLHQHLPPRATPAEAKADLDCFFHRCDCHKTLRDVPCLRYTKVDPKTVALLDYIDNDRGFRALPYKV